jgi:3-isopropylmalate/(R)-2-methylmalate dehydratase large subunit
MIAPDETTFEYLRGRPRAPQGEAWERALERWRRLPGDEGCTFDRVIDFDATSVEPMISYGTNPGMVIPITGRVPATDGESFRKALHYMGFEPGETLAGKPIDLVFLGSCTNARLSDLRLAASMLRGRKVARGVRMLVVPGSQQVKQAAEAEGLHAVFIAAGAEWRESGCSMCVGINGDTAAAGRYVVSTSNRNFEGRQGQGARTLLASPATAAACALTGRIADPREFAP